MIVEKTVAVEKSEANLGPNGPKMPAPMLGNSDARASETSGLRCLKQAPSKVVDGNQKKVWFAVQKDSYPFEVCYF